MNLSSNTAQLGAFPVRRGPDYALPGSEGFIGVTGPTGPIGATGITGDDGQAPSGPSGHIGGTGPTGPDGSIGATGFSEDGPGGEAGVGGDPLKLAIVPSYLGPISLFCQEASRVLFEDFYERRFLGNYHSFCLDNLFTHVCEDIKITSWVCDAPIFARVFLCDQHVQIETRKSGVYVFNITVRGTRKGFTSRYFTPTSEERRLRNNAFYSQAQ